MEHDLTQGFVAAIAGEGDHLAPMKAVEGITTAQACRHVHDGVATVWESLDHMVRWQDICVARLQGQDVKGLDSVADAWPAEPPDAADEAAWSELVARFEAGLKSAAEFAKTKDPLAQSSPSGQWTCGAILLSLADHNAYHLGVIVTVRRLLGLWPPPSGGYEW